MNYKEFIMKNISPNFTGESLINKYLNKIDEIIKCEHYYLTEYEINIVNAINNKNEHEINIFFEKILNRNINISLDRIINKINDENYINFLNGMIRLNNYFKDNKYYHILYALEYFSNSNLLESKYLYQTYSYNERINIILNLYKLLNIKTYLNEFILKDIEELITKLSYGFKPCDTKKINYLMKKLPENFFKSSPRSYLYKENKFKYYFKKTLYKTDISFYFLEKYGLNILKIIMFYRSNKIYTFKSRINKNIQYKYILKLILIK